MKIDFLSHLTLIQRDAAKEPSSNKSGKCKTALLAGLFLAIASAVLMLRAVPVLANDALPRQWTATEEHEQQFDWILHTRQTLDELKGKLNLAPAQLAAWDTWSAGVIKDSQQQLERKDKRRAESAMAKALVGSSTPERMARGIERLRAETAWMQEHLNQLEAAQVRTGTFYGALDINQKTIFDLFWHEMYHRVSGHDIGGSMPAYRHRSPMT